MRRAGCWNRRLSRAEFLQLTGVSAAAVLLGTGELHSGRAHAAPAFDADPFSLGVASGDPLHNSVVLWTRLAPDPLAADGRGGMPPEPVTVRYELARDPDFRHVSHRGDVEARSELAHSVHVEVRGLRPGFEYFYRFMVGKDVSPVGRTRTTPVGPVGSLRFALAGCQRWQDGYYTAHGAIADDQELDLVVFSGDYIYENRIGPAGGDWKQVLPSHFRSDCLTLDRYRCQYGLYKSDPDLQRAHAALPWISTWDDHEVDDNYAADHAINPATPPATFLLRRAAAYQAHYEHMPLRRTSVPAGPDMQMYRSLSFGRLAEFQLLDGRQYRSDQACGGVQSTPCPESLEPSRTMLGAGQERWLLDGLGRSSATWNVLAQQTIMCRADRDPGPELRTSMDNWNGYSPARQRLFDGVEKRRVENLVVLTGDAHASVAADIRLDYDDPASPTIGAEFVGTSVASGGDGADMDGRGVEFLGSNPHMRFYNARRGYVRCDVTPALWRTDFRAVPRVTETGQPVATIASFVVEAGRPGVQPA
jgi:alkaline phosphatase D